MDDNDDNVVDMLAEARDAQWTAQTFLGEGFVKAVAPAKVNLFLDVGALRVDGYHEVVTVLHALSLHDVMYVLCSADEQDLDAGSCDVGKASAAASGQASSSDAEDADDTCVWGGPAENLQITIDCVDKTSGFDMVTDELNIPARDNIVYKAIDAYAKALDRRQPERIAIRLEKNIPHGAGLGGGSSDAAATLLAMAHFWDEDVHDQVLLDVAHQLGSDVPFFLQGGCALCTNLGDTIKRTYSSLGTAVVIVKPQEGVPTSEAYRIFDKMSISSSPDLVESVLQAQTAQDIMLHNNLTLAAQRVVPEIAHVRTWLDEQAQCCEGASLSGSGSAMFAPVSSFAQACDIAAQAQVHGWWARATTFSSLRAAVLP